MKKILILFLAIGLVLSACETNESSEKETEDTPLSEKGAEEPEKESPRDLEAEGYDENGIRLEVVSEIPVIEIGETLRVEFCIQSAYGGDPVVVPMFMGEAGTMTESAYCASMPVIGLEAEEKNSDGYFEKEYKMKARLPTADGGYKEYEKEITVQTKPQ